MSLPLTDIPRVGKKTLNELSSLGVETGEELVRRYLSGSQDVRDALYSEKVLTQYLLSEPKVQLTNADFGIERTGVFAIPVLTFLYAVPPDSRCLTRAFTPRFEETTSLRPADVDWSYGLLGDCSFTYGVIYDTKTVEETFEIPLTEYTVNPTELSQQEDGHYLLSDGTVQTLIPKTQFESVVDLTTFGYDENPELISIHPSKNYGALFPISGGTDILIAPRTSDDFEATP